MIRAANGAGGDYGENFPASYRVEMEGPAGVRVPMREIRLSDGEPPLRVYDTSGPLGVDVHEGLPPGPIANPGSKSLQAVLAPATTKYLYFVTRGDRRHAFSETLEDHNRAVEDLKQRSQKQP